MRYTESMISGRLWAVRLGLLLTLGIPLSAFAQQASAPADPAPAQALRQRVEQFYSLLMQRQLALAEEYATKDSRSRFKEQAGAPFFGFRVISTTVKADGINADVAVEISSLVPFATSPVPVQRRSQWRLEESEWRLIVPDAVNTELDASMGKGLGELPKPEELEFVGHRYGLGMMKPGEVKEARFPFTNVTDHPVTITQVLLDCECLKLKTDKMEYQPGESGELVIEFDSTGYEVQYLQTILVRTDPGDVKTYLTIGAGIETPLRTREDPVEETTPTP